MKVTIIPTALLTAFWLALSGHYTILLLCFGAFSVVWIMLLSRRMDITDHEGVTIPMISMRMLLYWFWLAKEVLISCLSVAKMILSPTGSLSPTVEKLPTGEMTDVEKVIYANSITLTPGTLTLEVSDDSIEVHTIQQNLLEDLKKGTMANQIRQVFSKKDNRP